MFGTKTGVRPRSRDRLSWVIPNRAQLASGVGKSSPFQSFCSTKKKKRCKLIGWGRINHHTLDLRSISQKPKASKALSVKEQMQNETFIRPENYSSQDLMRMARYSTDWDEIKRLDYRAGMTFSPSVEYVFNITGPGVCLPASLCRHEKGWLPISFISLLILRSDLCTVIRHCLLCHFMRLPLSRPRKYNAFASLYHKHSWHLGCLQ